MAPRIDAGRRPRVLVVTGAYHPEVSGSAQLCQALVGELRERADFTVLTTATESGAAEVVEIDGVPVYRVPVDTLRPWSVLRAVIRLVALFVRLRGRFEIVHVHGFSRKMIPIVALTLALRKRLLLTLHTARHDEPHYVRTRGRVAFWCYSRADLVTGVSSGLWRAYQAAGLAPQRFRLIPNGVDLRRFRPAGEGERREIRERLGLPVDLPVLLFVGFFSREKQPDVLFQAWLGLHDAGAPPSGLVFVGATRGPYYEIDPRLAEGIRNEAQSRKLADRVVFVERAHAVAAYFRAVDVFVLPSAREASPLALLEAMACGLPCVASRLEGATEDVIDDGVNGLLVPPGDVRALERALASLLQAPDRRRALGTRARQTVEERHSIAKTAEGYLDAYRSLGSGSAWAGR